MTERDTLWNQRIFERIEALLGDRPKQLNLAALRQQDKAALKDEFYPRFYRNEVLDSNVGFTANGSWDTVLSTKLTTGIWWVSAQAVLRMEPNFLAYFYGRLYDAANSMVFASTLQRSPSSTNIAYTSINLSAIVRVRADYEPVRLDFDCRVPNDYTQATVYASAANQADKATNLIAWRVV